MFIYFSASCQVLFITHIGVSVGVDSCAFRLTGGVRQGKDDGAVVVGAHLAQDRWRESTSDCSSTCTIEKKASRYSSKVQSSNANLLES